MKSNNFSIVNREDLLRLYAYYYSNLGFNDITGINAIGNSMEFQIIKYYNFQDFENEFKCSVYFTHDKENGLLEVLVKNNSFTIDGLTSDRKIRGSDYLNSKYSNLITNENTPISDKNIIICEVINNKTKQTFYFLCDINELHLNEYNTIESDNIVNCYNSQIEIESKPNFNRLFKTQSFNNDSALRDNRFKNYNWFQATGIGCISGENSFRCLDIDGCSSLNFIKSICKSLKLPEDYEWIIKSGSNNGFHIWIQIIETPIGLIFKTKSNDLFKNDGVISFESKPPFDETFDRLEVRWNSHCVLPPSLSYNGGQYQFINDKLPINLPIQIDSNLLFDFINYLGINSTIDYNEIVKRRVGSDGSQNAYYFPQTMFLDIETTGFAKSLNSSYNDIDNWPHIVQISYIIDNHTKDFILKPETFEIPIESTKIHGISMEFANEKGWNRKDVFYYLLNQLTHIDYIVAHNTDFDINTLKCELIRNTNVGKNYIDKLFENIECICTMKSSVDFCGIISRNGNKWPSLNELFFTLFNKNFEGAHNSLNDVRATKMCFDELIRLQIISLNKPNLTENDLIENTKKLHIKTDYPF